MLLRPLPVLRGNAQVPTFSGAQAIVLDTAVRLRDAEAGMWFSTRGLDGRSD